MPARLARHLDTAHAAADLILASGAADGPERQDLLEPSTLHPIGAALARHGDARALAVVDASARRAMRGAATLRAQLPPCASGVELACLAQVTSMFRTVSLAANEYRSAARGEANVSAAELVALASVAVADEVTRESVDRVRDSLIITRRLVDSFRAHTEPGGSPGDFNLCFVP